MQIIKNNPYRQLGLLVGAKATQLNKHTTQIPMYLDAGQPIPDKLIEYGFNNLGRIERTQSSISSAAAKLTLNKDRIEAALFWFYNSNSISDIEAIDLLKGGQLSEALNVWFALVKVNTIEPINASAFQNVSTLLLLSAFARKTLNEKVFVKALEWKLKFIDSDYIYDFVSLATDTTYKSSKKELQLLILGQINAEIERTKIVSFTKYLEIINTLNFSAKDDFLSDCMLKLIAEIEKQIEEAKTKRKINKSDAITIGNTLYIETKHTLTLVRIISGNSNLRLISISDKLSEEILQCGIDYFKLYKESDNDSGSLLADTFEIANSLALGNILKERCRENIEKLKEWIKFNQIKPQFLLVIDKMQSFQDTNSTLNDAMLLINDCKPILGKIKDFLGYLDENYLGLSTKLASIVEQKIIQEVNQAQRVYKSSKKGKKIIHSVFQNAIEAYELIETLNFEFEFGMKIFENKNTLESNISYYPEPMSFLESLKYIEIPTWIWRILGIIGVLTVSLIGYNLIGGWGLLAGIIALFLIITIVERPWLLIFPALGAIIGLFNGIEGAGIGAMIGGVIIIYILRYSR